MKERTDCRCCRSTNLRDVFDLGLQPHANAFLRPNQLDAAEPKSPLIVHECADCGHAQLAHVVDAVELFSDYSFVTGSSRRMTEHFSDLMADNVERYVPRGGLVVEIGSNDGTALASIRRPDVIRLGIDPARNLGEIARARGVPTRSEFFTAELALSIEQKASLIIACNVLGHADDLDDFCRGVKSLLADDGAFVVEVPWVKLMVDGTEFDTIYHEHCSYFSVRSLATLLNRHGLRLDSVARQHVHGGTIRCTAIHGDGVSEPVQRWIDGEGSRDWRSFDERCQTLRFNLLRWLNNQRDAGRMIWGYGAPAKGTVLLNYCGIGTDLMPIVVDSTPQKQGRHVPGTHQLIRDPSAVVAEMPDAVVVLAWNHIREIADKETAYQAAGGLLMTPSLAHYGFPPESLDGRYKRACMVVSEIHEHLPRLRELAEQVESVTEFGLGHGNSTAAFLAGRPKRWAGYDIDPAFPGRENMPAGLHIADTATCDLIERTDLLFIDSLHAADHVAAELIRHSSRVRKYIVFHDTRPPWGDAVREGITRWRETPDAARWKLIEDRENSHGLQVWEASETNDPKHHLLISGYGRAGTTYLTQLFTLLGLDTGWSVICESYDDRCHAGLEHGINDPWPYVVKSPFLCDSLDEVIGKRGIVADHLIVPVRRIESAAESRRRNGRMNGGIWGSDGSDQESVLAEKLNRLLVSAARREIPVTLLEFPRLATDAEYLWRRIGPLTGRTHAEVTTQAAALSRPEWIHE